MDFGETDEAQKLQEFQYAADQCMLSVLIGKDGHVIDANQTFLRVSGYSQEEIFNRPFTNLLLNDFSSFYFENIERLISKGINWKGEICHIARNGRPFWTETTIVPIQKNEREIAYFCLIAYDVTERKAIETALADSARFFNKLMDLAPVGFFLADFNGHCTYINKKWVEIAACPLRKALGAGWLQSVHPDDLAEVTAAWSGLFEQGSSFNREFRYAHPDGKVVWVLASAEYIDLGPNAKTRFIRIEQDITEHKESENTIKEQRAKMVTAAKMSALGEMAGGIAHEINNPLAILQLQARHIQKVMEVGAIDTQLLERAAVSIDQTTERIAKIVRSLQAISREGQGDPFVSTQVKTIIEDALVLCSARFKSNSIDLILKPFDPQLVIECRPVEILQVLLNLLNNAFSAVIDLEEKWVELNILDVNNNLEIWVSDSGGPIPVDLREKIFQPFFTTKPVGSGTGLGLSIARASVLGHRGDLTLAMDSPQTRFILRLPKFQPPNHT